MYTGTDPVRGGSRVTLVRGDLCGVAYVIRLLQESVQNMRRNPGIAFL